MLLACAGRQKPVVARAAPPTLADVEELMRGRTLVRAADLKAGIDVMDFNNPYWTSDTTALPPVVEHLCGREAGAYLAHLFNTPRIGEPSCEASGDMVECYVRVEDEFEPNFRFEFVTVEGFPRLVRVILTPKISESFEARITTAREQLAGRTCAVR
jgi:hypothetical protein